MEKYKKELKGKKEFAEQIKTLEKENRKI